MASPLSAKIARALGKEPPPQPQEAETASASAPAPAEQQPGKKPAKKPKKKREKTPNVATPAANEDQPVFRFPHGSVVACLYSDGREMVTREQFARSLREVADQVEQVDWPEAWEGAQSWAVVLNARGAPRAIHRSGIHHAIHTLGQKWYAAQSAPQPAIEPAVSEQPVADAQKE